MSKVEKHPLGYYKIVDITSDFELKQYYQDKYYQEDESLYSSSYGENELRYISNRHIVKEALFTPFLSEKNNRSFLDVGCGEGYSLSYFKTKGWNVWGCDFSDFGIKHHNPELAEFAAKGDIFEILRSMESERVFDVIWLDNILEHVRDPQLLLSLCYEVCANDGLIVVDVPNDFSLIQSKALELGEIDGEFWIADPDHLSYFNLAGLKALFESGNWEHCRSVSDFPIDFNILNPHSNYVRDKGAGSSAHFQRCEIEHLMVEESVDKTLNVYQSLADIGLGRSINSVFRKGSL